MRGGNLQSSPARPLSEILSSLNRESPTRQGTSTFGASNPKQLLEQTWLDHRFETGSPLAPLLEDYRKAQSNAFKQLVEERTKQLSKSNYIGSQACQGCHADSYTIWSQSAHAHAYDILKKQGQHQNPECVGCHTLGFHEVGGFVSELITPQFKGVHCENCHGPRRQHIANPTSRIRRPRQT